MELHRPKPVEAVKSRFQVLRSQEKQRALKPEDFPIRFLNEAFVIRLSEFASVDFNYLLKDGTLAKRYSPMGAIDFMPHAQPEERVAAYWKRAHTQFEDGLHTLAQLAQTDPVLSQLQIFGGITRLAPMAEKYGFNAFDIDPDFITTQMKNSQVNSEKAAGENALWTKIRGSKTLPRQVLISRSHLIGLYGQTESNSSSQAPSEPNLA